MPYPSTITTFTNPLPTDRLNSPSHSSIETAQNTGLTELQTFVGTLASTAGTLIYDIRSANSDGGGHVQAVNKGGTGQTSYTKGDILIASSSSVLAKFAVGLDGQQTRFNSSTATGWEVFTPATTGNKIASSGSLVTVGTSTVAEQSIFSVTVPGSVLGTSNAIRATTFVSAFFNNTTTSVLLRTNYGATAVASTLLIDNTGGNIKGTIVSDILANNSTTAQRGVMNLDFKNDFNRPGTSVYGVNTFTHGTGAIDSSANQILGMTVRFSGSDASNAITIVGYEVEKITP